MSVKWQISEDAYLAANFSTASFEAMAVALGRTKNAIWSRAKLLHLSRPNAGRFTSGERPTGRQFAPGSAPKKPFGPLRKKVIDEFAEHQERTVSQLVATTGSTQSACWKTCDGLRKQGGLHIIRYQLVNGVANNWEAVYRIGKGEDAVKPSVAPREFHDPHAPLPVPRPTLGLWGLSW